MAAEPEGITALFSMYNDDDDDDEEEDTQRDQNSVALAGASSAKSSSPRSPLLADESADSKTLTLASPKPPTPQLPPSQHSSPFPVPSPSGHLRPSPAPRRPPADRVVEPSDSRRVKRGALAIVDYAHDEMAVSPDHEEGGIKSGSELQFAHETSQSFEISEKSKSETGMAMDRTVDESAVGPATAEEDDLLSRFLPPPVAAKCSEELQQKFNKFLLYKKSGKSFNADLRNRKDYRNPDFLQHAVRYQDIDQIGSCFAKDVFDPHGYDKSDYYDVIEADMRREDERKEQERKRSPKVDFVSGGTQPALIPQILKTSSIPAAAASGIPQVPSATGVAAKETRNKKSKWDKVDGDTKNPALSALLSAANAGAGYAAFVQQKRKEAEEKRTSDKKS